MLGAAAADRLNKPQAVANSVFLNTDGFMLNPL
jgi:hypothetical protein